MAESIAKHPFPIGMGILFPLGAMAFLGSAILAFLDDHLASGSWGLVAVLGTFLVCMTIIRTDGAGTPLLRAVALAALLSWAIAFPTGYVLSRSRSLEHTPRTVLFFGVPSALASLVAILLYVAEVRGRRPRRMSP